MKVIYYLPVSEKFLSKWEYFKVDLNALNDLFDEVVVCDSVWKLLLSFRGADAIYCWWWHRSIPAILFGRLFGIKTVATGALHMFDLSGAPDYYSGSWLFRKANAWGLRWADSSLFISMDQFRQVTSHLRVRNPIVVRSSLDKVQALTQEKILDARKALRNEAKRKIIFLSIAWQTRAQFMRKGIWETLDAMVLLKMSGAHPFEWVVAGKEGDGTDKLRFKIRELGLTNEVTVITDVSPAKKSELYLAADLYIQPSWCEGFGNAVLEAMSHGAPALVSRYTAQPEGVGESGLIALDVSPEDIASKLRDFLLWDETERQRLSERALDRALSEFSYQKRLRELAIVFSNLGVKIDAPVLS